MYATALAYATVATLLADNGLGLLAMREISSQPAQLSPLFSKFSTAKIVLFVPMLIILALIGLGVHLSKIEWGIASLITIRTVLQSYCQLQVAVIKALDQMRIIGPIQGLHSILLLVGLRLSYVYHGSVYQVIMILVGGQVFELVLEAAWLRRAGIQMAAVKLTDCVHAMLRSTTVGITLVLSMGVMRLDVIVLSFIRGAGAAGLFAAAQTVMMVVYVLGSLLGSVLFPEMSRLAVGSGELMAYTRRWIVITAAALVPCVVVGILIGPTLMHILFGNTFAQSGRLLVLMLPAMPFMIANAICLHEAFAQHAKGTYIGIYSSAAIMAVTLTPLAAFRFGAAGVATVFVAREMLVSILFARARLRSIKAGGLASPAL
jgi:O-antigen/teichoic acid export membrane protein